MALFKVFYPQQNTKWRRESVLVVNKAGHRFTTRTHDQQQRSRCCWFSGSLLWFHSFLHFYPQELSIFGLRGGRSDFFPLRSPPGPCRWTWRSQPVQRRRHRRRWARCPPWPCKRPSPWSTARLGTGRRPDHNTTGPCLNPNQRGTTSGPGSETDLRKTKQEEGTQLMVADWNRANSQQPLETLQYTTHQTHVQRGLWTSYIWLSTKIKTVPT